MGKPRSYALRETRSPTGLENPGLEVCPVTFADRAAFHNSTAAGKVANESDPNGKAAAEAEALWRWTCEQTGMLSGNRANMKAKGKRT